MRLRPIGERDQRGAKRGTVVGESIHGCDGWPGKDLPFDEPGFLQLREPGREHPLGDPRDRVRDLAEPGGALQEHTDDHTRPSLPEEGEHARESLVASNRVIRGLEFHAVIVARIRASLLVTTDI